MEEANDFYKEIGNTEKAKTFSDMLGIRFGTENKPTSQHSIIKA